MRARLPTALLCTLVARAALGDGITGYLEEDWAHSNETATDEAGNTQKSSSDQFTQRYRLTLDRAFFPLLRLNAGGTFEQMNLWSAQGVEESFARTRTSNGFANLLLGGSLLAGAASYNYRSSQAVGTPGSLILDEPSLSLNYRPTELPSLSLRLARTRIWDTAHVQEDLATLLAILGLTWQPVRRLNLQYTISYAQPDDRLHFTESQQVAQTAHADWGRDLGRGALVAAAVNVNDQRFEVTSAGPGSTLTTQQAPIAGLSLVETFPSVPTLDTLVATPALIDGNTSASAGLDLGFSVRLGGDQNLRDLGVQFGDVLTKVNTFYLWVDRTLLPPIAASFHFDAYQSDDNIRWTQVPLAGAPVFNGVLNRFEISLPVTAARYLKLVTLPLDPAVTIDKRFADVLVTELQVLLVTSVGVTPWQATTRELANFSGRTPVAAPGLFLDVNGIASRTTSSGLPAIETWLITEGLSYARKLGPVLVLNARGARQDDDQSLGHEGLFIYSASLSATPLPTLSHSLIYSGQTISNRQGFGTTNSLSFYNRATPWRGIGLLAGGAYSIVKNPTGSILHSDSVLFTGSFQPHPSFTFSFTYGHADSSTTGVAQPNSASTTNRVDTGITFNPVPALYVAAGLSRVVVDRVPHTLDNASLTFSPFPGGNLQLALNYNETYQDPGELTRLFTPSLRWNVRPGTMLTVSYVLLDNTDGGAAANHTRTFDVNFQTAL